MPPGTVSNIFRLRFRPTGFWDHRRLVRNINKPTLTNRHRAPGAYQTLRRGYLPDPIICCARDRLPGDRSPGRRDHPRNRSDTFLNPWYGLWSLGAYRGEWNSERPDVGYQERMNRTKLSAICLTQRSFTDTVERSRSGFYPLEWVSKTFSICSTGIWFLITILRAVNYRRKFARTFYTYVYDFII